MKIAHHFSGGNLHFSRLSPVRDGRIPLPKVGERGLGLTPPTFPRQIGSAITEQNHPPHPPVRLPRWNQPGGFARPGENGRQLVECGSPLPLSPATGGGNKTKAVIANQPLPRCGRGPPHRLQTKKRQATRNGSRRRRRDTIARHVPGVCQTGADENSTAGRI